mmetsp:Transcript_128960/g.223758  ORF Transcript_128960/g.223758 Transcript_128960/m.223758 type:complete len:273 (+) Transcript_128960:47-865(+)
MSEDQVWIGDLPAEFTDEHVKATFTQYGAIAWLKTNRPKQAGQNASALVQFSTVEDAQWVVENLNGNIPEGLTEPVQVKISLSKESSKGGKGGKSGKGGKESGKSTWNSSNGGNNYGKAGGKGSAGKGSSAAASAPYAAPSAPVSDGKGAKGKGAVTPMQAIINGALKAGLLPALDYRPDENCVYVTGLTPDCTDRDLYELFAPFGAIQARGIKASQKGGVCSGIGWIDFTDNASTMMAIQSLNGFDNGQGGTLMLKQKNSGGKKGKGGKKW